MRKTRSLLLITVSGLLLLPASAPAEENNPAEFIHSPIQRAEENWIVETEDGAQPIENITTYCVDCHSDMEEDATRQIHGSNSDVHSHPVDQPYPATGAGLVPLNELDQRLLLVDGKMTCITCHRHDSPDHQLVIPDAFGKLCISCHKK